MSEGADLTTKQIWEELRHGWLRQSRRDALLAQLQHRYATGDHDLMTCSSTYPNEQFDRHGTPRGVAAAEWPSKRNASYDAMQRGLAASLVPYVSADDVGLTREQFLRTVISRITDDLEHRTY